MKVILDFLVKVVQKLFVSSKIALGLRTAGKIYNGDYRPTSTTVVFKGFFSDDNLPYMRPLIFTRNGTLKPRRQHL